MSLRPRLLLPAAILLLFSLAARADAPGLDRPRTALLQGRVDEAAGLLRVALASDPRNPTAHQLLCRVFYAQEQAAPAVSECELAVAAAPADTDNQMWLGRAYGLKAAHASPFAAFSLARKVRTAFETAVQTGPRNVHAMSDLGEFYVAAPGIVGGGLDKAQRLAAQMMPQFPAQAHRLLAQIADKNKDAATAEAEYKNAVAAARTPATYTDLGLFYQAHGHPDQAVPALQAAIAANRAHDASLVDAASILIAANRAPDLAERSLRDYLASSAQTDDAPVFKVHLQLANLLTRRGDLAGARQHLSAATSLAANFAAARKSAQGL